VGQGKGGSNSFFAAFNRECESYNRCRQGRLGHNVAMNSKLGWFLFAVAVIACAVLGAAWYQSHERLHDLRQAELAPIAALLNDDQELLKALQADSTFKSESGILGSYLAAIRADGVAKHAETKQRLDRLAENNAGILALSNAYLAHASSAGFRTEAQRFQRYAIAWRDRWNSVMELFMAGGNYPVAEVQFPREFAAAVKLEIAAIP
jgi:hypothetical protein